MTISTRTPEGQPNHCPVCDAAVKIEPSDPSGDAPCPNCGHLLWFSRGSSHTDTLASIIAGLCQQDPERWRQFYAIYRPIVLAYLHRQGLKEYGADEVVQYIFLKVFGKIGAYNRGECSFQSWLFNVAQKTLIEMARRGASAKKPVAGWALNVLRATPSDIVKLEEEWTAMYRERILQHALKVVRVRVSSRVWACFEQRTFQNHPASEIARDLNLAPNAVYVNAYRVMKLVRTICEEFDEDMTHGFESDLS
jgi:RNA polymerase sigma factor (sigma-70 family)